MLLVLAAFLAACGGSGSKSSTSGSAGTETTAVEGETTTLPAGAVAGLDDYDGDGQPDPTCGTQDFGAGLVLRVPCTISTASEPPQGTRLVPGSLYRLPGPTDVDLTGISGSLIVARDAGGAKVVIAVFNSDALFDVGSTAVHEPETLDGIIRVIDDRWPRARIQVRGHTDSTGSPAANQTLSEGRAASVKEYLQSHGIDAQEVSSVGLGSSQPLTEEREPDGSPSAEGMRFNRRVEVVIRPQ